MACFITFEGIEGCGKTTQIRLLAQSLRELGYGVTVTREPGGSPIADQIRGILLDAANSAMVPLTELLLYGAARAQHVAEIILPALEAGEIVLCDRFTDATIAYQGFGRGLDRATIELLNRLAAGELRPHATILLDCPVDTGLTRALARINAATAAREERFELESRQFHERVRDGYLSLVAREPQRFAVVDGSGSIETTADTILAIVQARLTGSEPCRLPG